MDNRNFLMDYLNSGLEGEIKRILLSEGSPKTYEEAKSIISQKMGLTMELTEEVSEILNRLYPQQTLDH